MAKEIVVWCDIHLAGGERQPASQSVIGLGGKWRAVDLCDKCVSTFVVPVQEIWDKYGLAVDDGTKLPGRAVAVPHPPPAPRPPSGTRRGRTPQTARDRPCLWCELSFVGNSGINEHVRKIHGIEGPEALGGSCPRCGQEYTPGMGLAVHVTRIHGYANIWAAFKESADNELSSAPTAIRRALAQSGE